MPPLSLLCGRRLSMKIKASLLLISAFSFCFAIGQSTTQLSSPNGKIVCTLRVSKEGIHYRVTFDKKVLVDFSRLALQFEGRDFYSNLSASAALLSNTTEHYELMTGKTSRVTTQYKEATITLQEKEAPHQKVRMTFRAFDDGIAFRYEFISRDQSTSFLLTDEWDEFRLTDNPVCKV